MITLLLILFISLFSICPTNHQVVDQLESKDIPVKNVAHFGDYFYYSTYSDYTTTDFLKALVHYDSVLMQNNDFANFTGNRTRIYFYNELYKVNLNDIDFSDPSNVSTSTPVQYMEYWSLENSNNHVYYCMFYYSSTSYFYITWKIFDNYNTTDPASYILDGDLTNTIIRFDYDDHLGTYFDLGFFAYKLTFGNLDQFDLLFNFKKFSWSYQIGYNFGYMDGKTVGISQGYQSGYNQALEESAEINSTASTIFNGIFEVGLLPVNVFLSIFNFEVFGINVSGIVSALLTISIIIIILRFLLGGKSNDK